MASKRSHSVMSDSSGSSFRGSPFSSSSMGSTKKGRNTNREEFEQEGQVVEELADLLFDFARVNIAPNNTERPAEERADGEVDQVEPLSNAFMNYINSLKSNSSGIEEKSKCFMKDVIDKELRDSLRINEDEDKDKRQIFLKYMSDVDGAEDEEEREENVQSNKYRVYIPNLPPGPCYGSEALQDEPEISSRCALQKFIDSSGELAKDPTFKFAEYIAYCYPILYYTYMGDADKVIEIIDYCPAARGMPTSCECFKRESHWQWSPLVIAACHGNIQFIQALDKAADRNTHLRSLMRQFVAPIQNGCGLTFHAVENHQTEMLYYLYHEKLDLKYRNSVTEDIPLIWDEMELGYKYTLAAVATAHMNVELIQFFFNPECPRKMTGAELDRIVLEAVNTDDVQFTKWVLDNITALIGRHKQDRNSRERFPNIAGVLRGSEDNLRDTAFHRAILRRNAPMLDLLREYDGRRPVKEGDANCLTPQYFALSVGMQEVFDGFEEDCGRDVNHLTLSCDIGLETGQEHLCTEFIEASIPPKLLHSFLRKAIACRCLNVAEKLVESILFTEKDDDDRDWVYSDALIVALEVTRRMTLRNRSSPEVRAQNVKRLTDCVAMLINAGAKVPYDHFHNFPPETAAPEIYEIFRRMFHYEETDGHPLFNANFVALDFALDELLERRLPPVPTEAVPHLRDLRPYLFPM